MSHELRTPLNAILGIGDMMREEAADAGQADLLDPLGRINRAGRHLLQLVNDVLDLSKIEAGRLEVHPEEVLVRGFVADIETTGRPLATRNANQFVCECPDDIGSLQADPPLVLTDAQVDAFVAALPKALDLALQEKNQ